VSDDISFSYLEYGLKTADDLVTRLGVERLLFPVPNVHQHVRLCSQVSPADRRSLDNSNQLSAVGYEADVVTKKSDDSIASYDFIPTRTVLGSSDQTPNSMSALRYGVSTSNDPVIPLA